MDFTSLNRLIRIFQKFQFALRNDRAAREQIRILVLGIIMCIVVYYLSQSIFIAPKEKELKKIRTRGAEVTAITNNQQMAMLGPKIVQLEHKKAVIQEDIAILKLREELQREHWRSLGNSTRFNNIIFTMSPAAPINIAGKLLQMNLGEKRSFEIHEVQPIILSGKGKYHDVIAYLDYLEKSPEIGSIDNLSLHKPTGKDLDENEAIDFSMLVSRIILKDQ